MRPAKYISDGHTVESVITNAIGAASQKAPSDLEDLLQIAEVTSKQVRGLVTSQLTKLLDMEAVAVEWNDGIEAAIQMVEDLS